MSRSFATLLKDERITSRPITVLGEGGTKGVDLAGFRPRDVPRRADELPVIGFLGRLSRDKGIGDLPGILARVRTVVPGVRCLVVGGEDHDDPPDAAAFAALRADPAVEMLGAVSDVLAVIRRMIVLCFPSLREGLPNAVIEAAACGVPTVAGDATGTRDLVRDGETGFLVTGRDEARMAARLVELLADRDRFARAGRAARALVERHWGSEPVERAMLDHLGRLAGPDLLE